MFNQLPVWPVVHSTTHPSTTCHSTACRPTSYFAPNPDPHPRSRLPERHGVAYDDDWKHQGVGIGFGDIHRQRVFQIAQEKQKQLVNGDAWKQEANNGPENPEATQTRIFENVVARCRHSMYSQRQNLVEVGGPQSVFPWKLPSRQFNTKATNHKTVFGVFSIRPKYIF